MSSWDGLNRRKFPRVNYPCQIIVRGDHEQADSLLAHTDNVGVGGVAAVIKKNLKMFTPIELELDLLDFGEHIKCRGKVVWSVRRRDDDPQKPMFYDIGIEFVDLQEKDRQRIEKVLQLLGKKNTSWPQP